MPTAPFTAPDFRHSITIIAKRPSIRVTRVFPRGFGNGISMALPETSPVFLPEVKIRESYASRRLLLHVLKPPYPALGLGSLRVLRVRDRSGGVTEIVAGYDGYERLPAVVSRK